MEVNGYEIKAGANLKEASLKWADLKGANLEKANLKGADLEKADLEGADLKGANLREANLEKAYLERAYLWGALLSGAELKGANLPHFQICPQEGSFIAYKKISSGVITIEIPAEARRTSSLVGRKCRAEYVKVIEGLSGYDKWSGKIRYEVNKMVYPDAYDDDIRLECTHGIHFFMTKEEASKWQS